MLKTLLSRNVKLVAVAIAGLLLWSGISMGETGNTLAIQDHQGPQQVTFAAGCFWCTESLFQETDGVGDVISGYAGGEFPDPTYQDVISQKTDHREAVQFEYDPNATTYDELLDLLLQNIDPSDAGGQFVDRGFSYTTAIFYHTNEQKKQAEAALENLAAENPKFEGIPIATKVLPFTTFYQAEDYHQDFYLNSSERYKDYDNNSGRKEFKEFVWDKIIEENQNQ